MGSATPPPGGPSASPSGAVPDPAGRLIDANLNRAAEALRVVEDVCRFHWNLPALCEELKQLRHSLLALFAPDAGSRMALAACRDIEGDIGRDIPSPAAPGNASLETAAVRNLERVKEALRVLEEASRATRPDAAKAVEALRYRAYSLEKGILHLAGGGRGAIAAARLCLILTRRLLGGPLEDILRGALDGGAGAVQMREKDAPDRDLLSLGRRLREITARAGAALVVNDRPDLARLLAADGVHLGQEDLPVRDARAIAGDALAVGVSTHSEEQARLAARDGADYVGIGPVFATSTKDVGPPIGPEGYRRICRAVDLPAFAIGGIAPKNAASIAAAGARRVAVSSAILGVSSGAEARRAAEAILAALPPPDGGNASSYHLHNLKT